MSSPMTTPGAFSWIELLTTDTEAAKKFYGGLFGWTFDKVEGFDYELVKVSGQQAAGMMKMPPSCPPGTPPCWGNYVTVNSADEACEKARSLGGQVLVEPQDIPTIGRFAVLQDPQGAVISVFQWAMNQPPAEPK